MTSKSVTSLAATFTVHVVPAGSGDSGVNVNMLAADVVGSAGNVENVRTDPSGHSRLKAPGAAFTGSPKLRMMDVLTETFVAPTAGVVLLTLGAVSPLPHGASVVAIIRGAGVPMAKSLLLTSVSVQP